MKQERCASHKQPCDSEVGARGARRQWADKGQIGAGAAGAGIPGTARSIRARPDPVPSVPGPSSLRSARARTRSAILRAAA
ncbi:hypothetical protein MOX02_20960 [Methylobacterium oxalidis]|uniref:Uncharacterized protein n=1 Tax=Methylobacterium oxalidis TaxID=944322 RepID=A0A512J268_9HYPH|nr:hypothetical protein MOX02_20960 [Methylobacterium oxalidis]GLS65113.1 hypothetical protein GCM10007888_34940 [Methylobacterium oxalidis]